MQSLNTGPEGPEARAHRLMGGLGTLNPVTNKELRCASWGLKKYFQAETAFLWSLEGIGQMLL